MELSAVNFAAMLHWFRFAGPAKVRSHFSAVSSLVAFEICLHREILIGYP